MPSGRSQECNMEFHHAYQGFFFRLLHDPYGSYIEMERVKPITWLLAGSGIITKDPFTDKEPRATLWVVGKGWSSVMRRQLLAGVIQLGCLEWGRRALGEGLIVLHRLQKVGGQKHEFTLTLRPSNLLSNESEPCLSLFSAEPGSCVALTWLQRIRIKCSKPSMMRSLFSKMWPASSGCCFVLVTLLVSALLFQHIDF